MSEGWKAGERRFFVTAERASLAPDIDISDEGGFKSLKEAEAALAEFWSRGEEERLLYPMGLILEMVGIGDGSMERAALWGRRPSDPPIQEIMASLEAQRIEEAACGKGRAKGSMPKRNRL